MDGIFGKRVVKVTPDDVYFIEDKAYLKASLLKALSEKKIHLDILQVCENKN